MGVAAVAAAGGIAYWAKGTIDAIDQTSKLAQITGDTTENILKLRHAAVLSGSSIEGMDKALLRMSSRLGEAKVGVGEATNALAHLGLDIEEVVDLAPAEAIMKLSDAVASLGTQAEKSSVIKDIFGRSGQELMVLFDAGSEGIRKMGNRLAKSALYTREQARAAEELNDSLYDLEQAFRGTFTSGLVNNLQLLSVMVDSFRDASRHARDLLDTVLDIGHGLFKLAQFGMLGAEHAQHAFLKGKYWTKWALLKAWEALPGGEAKENDKAFGQMIEAQLKLAQKEIDDYLANKTPLENMQAWLEDMKARAAAFRFSPTGGQTALAPPVIQKRAAPFAKGITGLDYAQIGRLAPAVRSPQQIALDKLVAQGEEANRYLEQMADGEGLDL